MTTFDDAIKKSEDVLNKYDNWSIDDWDHAHAQVLSQILANQIKIMKALRKAGLIQ